MAISARYVHTNVVARDWRRLAEFYKRVFGCEPVGPQRHNKGEWVEQLTGIEGCEVQGIHLQLPGYESGGPTLEIFQFHPQAEGTKPAINRPGLAHIAFAVDDVEEARQAVLEAGGSQLGDLVTATIPGAGTITVIYMRDPEGNIIELQRWQ